MALSDFKKEEAKEKLTRIRIEAEEKKAQETAQFYHLPYIDLVAAPVDVNALSFVPEAKARQGLFVPFQKINQKIYIAAFDPKSETLNETLKELAEKGFDPEVFICSLRSLKRGFEEYKKVPNPKKEITGKIEISSQHIDEIQKEIRNVFDLKEALKDLSKKETTWILEVILGSSLSLKASDIHIVPEENSVSIRYRIDGILHNVIFLDRKIYHSLLNRIKILGNLKLNIIKKAQDGRFSIFAKGKEVEVRVSVMPGEYGEDIVMRILDPEMILSIEQLGLHSWHEKEILDELQKSNGMILSCGPTGEGKTTTLYACLKKIATPAVKIISIEDPIEYHLEGISQTQVDPGKGYDFANALRAVLRQDPDVILVGEIRDGETADTAIQAALTGHLVFSTLHTNDSAGVVPRLIEMGVSPASIAPALNLAMSQRLIRRVCKKCAKKIPLSEELKTKFEKNLSTVPSEIKPNLQGVEIFQAQGCRECHNTGYLGRIGIFEMFRVTKAIEEVILSSPSIFSMRETAIKEGMITLQQDGLLRVIEGVTTLEEIQRVTGPLQE